MDAGHLDGFIALEGRQEVDKPDGGHCLSHTGRAENEQMMPPCSCYLTGALEMLLTDHVGVIELPAGLGRVGTGIIPCADCSHVSGLFSICALYDIAGAMGPKPAEAGDLPQMSNGADSAPAHYAGFPVIFQRNETVINSRF